MTSQRKLDIAIGVTVALIVIVLLVYLDLTKAGM
jgi:hypothetical protein